MGARLHLLNDDYHDNEFCWRVWDEADSWLASHLDGVAETMQYNGDDKGALSNSDGDEGWTVGWVQSWIRNSAYSLEQRKSILHNAALHEAGHKICRFGDTSVCDASTDEDGIDRAIADCYMQH
jgi:hypothetical protein